MKKMAIFVEGGTELAFAEKMLLEVAGARNIQIRKEKDRGGARSMRMRTLVGVVGQQNEPQYYARIIDCGNDDRVRSVLRENYKTLCAENYQSIVGFRDVRGVRDGVPMTIADVPKVRRWMAHGVSTTPIRPVMVLAVMETEAWFLAEYTHFQKVDPSLTLSQVTSVLSFDPSTGDVEQRPQPAEDLDAVYRTVGKFYDKKPVSTQATIDVLDYGMMYMKLGQRVPGIVPLVSAIDDFLK